MTDVRRVPKDRHCSQAGQRLLQKLDSLSTDLVGHGGNSGDVSAGPGQAGDEPGADWVGDPRHDNGDCLCEVLCCEGSRRVDGEDDVHLCLREFTGQGLQSIIPTLGEPPLNREVAPLLVPKLAETLPKCFERIRNTARGRRQHSDPISRACLLRDGVTRDRENGQDETEGERENDREPDPPHGHLRLRWLAGSLADLNYRGTALDCWPREASTAIE